jgi:hypothetical protein
MMQKLDNIVASNMPYGTALLGAESIPDTGFDLMLDDTMIEDGDLFHLHYNVYNPTDTAYNADIWIILDVYGQLFMYPSWVNIEDNVDYRANVMIDPMTIHHRAALLFIWPSDVGAADGLYFHGAATSAGTFDFIGDVHSIMWSYM